MTTTMMKMMMAKMMMVVIGGDVMDTHAAYDVYTRHHKNARQKQPDETNWRGGGHGKLRAVFMKQVAERVRIWEAFSSSCWLAGAVKQRHYLYSSTIPSTSYELLTL